MLPGKQYTPADYAAMAWRWRWVIIVPLLLGAYVALIVSSQLRDTFQSEMLIQVIPQRVPEGYVRSTVTMRTVDRLSTLSEQIMSRTELEKLITEMNLYPEDRARLPMQDVVEQMRYLIKVDPVLSYRSGRDPDSNSFYVRFSYSDAATARRVTERLGGLFVDVNARDRGNLAQAINSFLETQLGEARGRLEKTEERLRRFREQNAGRLPTQITYNMQAMQNSQLRVQALVESLARDRDRKLMLERLYTDAEAEVIVPPPPPAQSQATQSQSSNPLPVLTGNTAQQLALARQALIGFELRLKPEHPDVVRTKGLIAKLESQLAEETKLAEEARRAAREANSPEVTAVPILVDQREVVRQERLKGMRAEVESLERQIVRKEEDEQTIRRSLEDVQHRIEQVPGVESEWISLSRDYETQQTAYRQLLAKSEDAKLAANLEERQIGEQFKVLDPAREPVRPTGVERLNVNGMGAGIGFGLGVLLAALLELRDRTFRRADDIVDVLKLPVLALVPQVVTETDRQRARVRRRLVSVAAAVLVLACGYGFWAMQLWKFIT